MRERARQIIWIGAVFWVFFCLGQAYAAQVDPGHAKNAAENWITHQVQLHNAWGDSNFTYPYIADTEEVIYQDTLVAYNFLIHPQGHILVPVRDELPPIKLYSDSRTLSLEQRVDLPGFLRMVLHELYQGLELFAGKTAGLDLGAVNHEENSRLWSVFGVQPDSFGSGYRDYITQQMDLISMGPLLSAAWAQGDPYNQQTPLWYDGNSTLVGCVATAAGQVMRYHKWPETGQRSHSYEWYNGQETVTLSSDFSSHTYDWDNMPDTLPLSSSSAKKDAVALLLADVGIAYEMVYGTYGSGASTSWGTYVLPEYFKYKDTISWKERSDYDSDSEWMHVFKNEIYKQRPALFSIAEDIGGERRNGHSVVVDGWRNSPNEQIHINMGWSGSYNAWYASNNIETQNYNFDWFGQGAVIGIEPDKGTAGPEAEVIDVWQVENAQAGKSSSLWAEVKNTGSSALPSDAQVWYYVTNSQDEGEYVGSASVSGLNAGSKKWYKIEWSIPSTAPSGTYTYWARIYQGNTALSAWSKGQTFTVTSSLSAEAQVTSLWEVQNAQAGKSSSLWAEVKNTGSTTLPSDAQVWYYVRNSRGEGKYVGNASASGLGAGSRQWYKFNWSISSADPSGVYTYWARVYQGNTPLSAWSDAQEFSVAVKSPASGMEDDKSTLSYE